MKRLALVVGVLALSTAGWDTRGFYTPEEPPQWISMYHGPLEDAVWGTLVQDGEINRAELERHNEHQELAHIAMLQLGWHDALYTTPFPFALDLNATVWRPQVGMDEANLIEGDLESTPLVERRIPHPGKWAGVADFSYTAYDWLNRNQLCPSLPDSEPTVADCHTYTQWLGAALNSSHFGEQATKMYKRLHVIALLLGTQAGSMREALARNVDEADAPAIEAMIREAELEALAFEGYAQHFLHDRWSTGHMWSRYGLPEYGGPGTLTDYMSVGLYAGLIHGAEALFTLNPVTKQWAPDSLCSPLVDEDFGGGGTAIPASYVGGGREPTPGIGDYRLRDMVDGAFGAEYDYPDLPIDVTSQLEEMLMCSRAGWADVARRFGDNGDGTAGLHALFVDSQATFDATINFASENGDEISCWDTWVTNESMLYALNDPYKPTFYKVLDAVASGTMSWSTVQFAGNLVGLDMADFGKAYVQLQEHARKYPTRTDLADGTALIAVQGIGPGNEYLDQVPASYIEPDPPTFEDPFSELPLHADGWDLPDVGDRAGRDRHTLHGYFNKAHAGDWCEISEQVLEVDPSLALTDPAQGLRWPVPLPAGGGNQPSADEEAELNRRLDACTLLADRLFDRTYAWYRGGGEIYLGAQRELRRVGHGDQNALVAQPACATLEVQPPTWDDGPIQLHPGYVSRTAGPYATEPFYGDVVYESIRNWCMQVPVVHVDDNDVAVDATGAPIAVHPGFRDDGSLSFEPDVRDPEVTLYGENFGDAAGQVQLDSERGCVTDPPVSHFADVIAWSDTQITIRVPHTRFVPDHYRITIIRPDRDVNSARVRNPGLARLDVQRAAFGDVGDVPGALPTDIVGQLFAAIHPFCAGSDVTRHTVHDCTGVDEATCGADGGTGTLLWSNGVPAGYQPGPYAAHQWGVMQTGICSALPTWVVCLPQYPAGSGTYGMIYRFERTSTAPVTTTPKRWRWTLVWQRPGPL